MYCRNIEQYKTISLKSAFFCPLPASRTPISSHKKSMISIAHARKIIESKQPIDITFWKKNGEIVHAHSVVCTSSNFENNTFNIKFIDSEEVRKIKALLIFNVNGEEVFL